MKSSTRRTFPNPPGAAPRAHRPQRGQGPSRTLPAILLALGVVALPCGSAFAQKSGGAAVAAPTSNGSTGCEKGVQSLFNACKNEIRDDYWVAVARCQNLSDPDAQTECLDTASEDFTDARDDCDEMKAARADLCDDLGEDTYEPDWDAGDFTNVFNGSNPYFPLEAGNLWMYQGGAETTTVEVLSDTKLIDGVTCIVVNDVVSVGGNPIEDTDDWYGQATNGDVWYCGELARDYETFAGDTPPTPELIEIEGSFKAGRDGDRPGVLMYFDPPVGDFYRQEWSLGNAEDAAEVLSDDYGWGNDAEIDALVPQALVEALCNDDCVVTRDFTPIEPGVEEIKIYAYGIGPILEIDPETGDTTAIVSCNLPACAAIP